jgi:hypothetical protein
MPWLLFQVMSNIPKMGQFPTPAEWASKTTSPLRQGIQGTCLALEAHGLAHQRRIEELAELRGV